MDSDPIQLPEGVEQLAIDVLAGEGMLFRFGGKLVEGEYLIKSGSGIYRRSNAPVALEVVWEQAEENARRLLASDRLLPAIIAQEREKWEIARAKRAEEMMPLWEREGVHIQVKAQVLAKLREGLKQIFGRVRSNARDGAELAVLEQIERNLSTLEQDDEE